MEHNKTAQALQVAIKMELDGKEFYLRASRQSSNEAGKKLMASLAAEEDIHRQKFVEIFKSIEAKKGWPAIDYKSDGGRALQTLFARATKELGTKVKVGSTELDTVKIAMDMEKKTYDYYQAQLTSATHATEKSFYEELSAQERKHHMVLQDYYEYIKDPAQYFTIKEHHSLDGG
jgi:rubrerythrin